jgi:hypothetical protein
LATRGHRRVDAEIEEAHREMGALLAARDELLPSSTDIAADPSLGSIGATWRSVAKYIGAHLSDHADSVDLKVSDSDCFEALSVLAGTLNGLSSDLEVRGRNGKPLDDRSRAFARLAVSMWAEAGWRGERREFLVNLAGQMERLAAPPALGADDPPNAQPPIGPVGR